ncbi:hypothetical protein D3C81_1272040 [compost metagenome]
MFISERGKGLINLKPPEGVRIGKINDLLSRGFDKVTVAFNQPEALAFQLSRLILPPGAVQRHQQLRVGDMRHLSTGHSAAHDFFRLIQCPLIITRHEIILYKRILLTGLAVA